MAQTYEQQLEEVQTTMSRLLSDGQAWSQGQRSQTEARLAELRSMEKELRQKIARQRRGGIRLFRMTPR